MARSTGRFAGSDHQLLFVLELSFSAVMSMQRKPLRLKVPEAFMAVNTVVDHLDEPFFEKQLLLDGQFCKPYSVAHVKKNMVGQMLI